MMVDIRKSQTVSESSHIGLGSLECGLSFAGTSGLPCEAHSSM
jgi:hypothetical protein